MRVIHKLIDEQNLTLWISRPDVIYNFKTEKKGVSGWEFNEIFQYFQGHDHIKSWRNCRIRLMSMAINVFGKVQSG